MPIAARSLALLLPLLLAGCGSSGSGGGGTVDGGVLRIYSSQPLTGRLQDQARAVVNGERLALEDAGRRVGRWRVEYEPLDDADPETGIWNPGLVSANARKAAQDDRTIAYLGEMETGASAVSIPILNETGILDVSPLDTVAGFTRERGASPGEPDKYYPTRDRNFARLVPPDDVQADALVSVMAGLRVRRLFIAQDGKLYGQSLSRSVARGARARGIEVVKVQAVDPRNVDAAKLAEDVAASGADAFLYSGEPYATVAPVFRAVVRASPRIELLGTSALADDAFAGQLGGAGSRAWFTAPWLGLRAYPAAARRLARRYQRRFGSPMPPQALYGYEAMGAVLAAIRRAGGKGNDRGEVIDQMLDHTRNRRSVLGAYSIDRNGDVSTTAYGVWRPRDGRLAFVRVVGG